MLFLADLESKKKVILLPISFSMKHLNKIFFLIGILWLFSLHTFAQKSDYGTKNYKKHAVWIQMMNDPKANYFETIKAFREYWKDRVLPKEPFENESSEAFEKEVGLEKEGASEKEREREEKERQSNAQDGAINYGAEVRAFKGWMQDTKPWLRADGSIISAEERQSIIDKQSKELKAIELQNRKK